MPSHEVGVSGAAGKGAPRAWGSSPQLRVALSAPGAQPAPPQRAAPRGSSLDISGALSILKPTACRPHGPGTPVPSSLSLRHPPHSPPLRRSVCVVSAGVRAGVCACVSWSSPITQVSAGHGVHPQSGAGRLQSVSIAGGLELSRSIWESWALGGKQLVFPGWPRDPSQVTAHCWDLCSQCKGQQGRGVVPARAGLAPGTEPPIRVLPQRWTNHNRAAAASYSREAVLGTFEREPPMVPRRVSP